MPSTIYYDTAFAKSSLPRPPPAKTSTDGEETRKESVPLTVCNPFLFPKSKSLNSCSGFFHIYKEDCRTTKMINKRTGAFYIHRED